MGDPARALGWALTGTDLGAGPDEPVDATVVVDWLDARGWDAARVREHRAVCQARHEPWPHPTPPGWVEQWARHASLLREVRSRLGADGLAPSVHRGPLVLGPAERRLLADKPPHHGSV